ncbi:hypothetical protein CDAR_95651 [Caerostris darwini]|uniref:Uncharacterized protein n=1 Tax=Caerostris darwini TaxID=1538125 RepID=A0AAV4UQ76_9ARAC|nr:hypothetical protein CDAR_95651 [Caerostris darwini]
MQCAWEGYKWTANQSCRRSSEIIVLNSNHLGVKYRRLVSTACDIQGQTFFWNRGLRISHFCFSVSSLLLYFGTPTSVLHGASESSPLFPACSEWRENSPFSDRSLSFQFGMDILQG